MLNTKTLNTIAQKLKNCSNNSRNNKNRISKNRKVINPSRAKMTNPRIKVTNLTKKATAANRAITRNKVIQTSPQKNPMMAMAKNQTKVISQSHLTNHKNSNPEKPMKPMLHASLRKIQTLRPAR